MLKSVPISKLKANPFRRLEEYPIIRTKIDALIESFETTGYWGNVVARKVGDKYEIAYGHHRLQALREVYPKTQAVEIIVRDLTNEQMIQIMARENMEEWGTSAWVEIETIRSVIDAYGKGEIELPKVPKNTPPAYIRELRESTPAVTYTKFTVAEFLGWTSEYVDKKSKKKVKEPNYACDSAFRAMDMIDDGFIKESDLRGLSREQSSELIRAQWSIHQAHMRVAKANAERATEAKKSAATTNDASERRRFTKQAEVFSEQAKILEKKATAAAKQFGKQSADDMRSGKASVRDVRIMADERKPTNHQAAAALDVDQAMQKTEDLLGRFANGDDQLSAYMAVIRKHTDEASDRSIRNLDKAFVALVNRLEKMRKPLSVRA